MKKETIGFSRTIIFNGLMFISIFSIVFGWDTASGNCVSVAYLDPGTGSMIISAIVGIFATIVLGVKTFWYKIIGIFKPGKKQSSVKASKKVETPSTINK